MRDTGSRPAPISHPESGWASCLICHVTVVVGCYSVKKSMALWQVSVTQRNKVCRGSILLVCEDRH